MITGIGTDIVNIARIAAVLERQGQRFAERILNAAELQEYVDHPHQARYLSKRFAVKEAASKALGTGIGQGVSWHDISLDHTALGAPVLILEGKAYEHAQRQGSQHFHVSLADEVDSVVAFVVMSKN